MAEQAGKSRISAPLSATQKPLPGPLKYPSEEETYYRRLGSTLLAHWSEVPEELRATLQAEAAKVWDREYNIPKLAQKLDAFIKRHAKK